MRRTLFYLVAATACALAQPQISASATVSTNQAGVRAEVWSITEHRGTDSKCHLMLKFTGDALASKTALLRTRVTRAVDDTGLNLAPSNSVKSFKSFGWGSSGFNLAPLQGWFQEHATKTWHGGVQLAGSPRGAKTITQLEGEIEMFAPTLENGGVVIIGKIPLKPEVEFQSAALDKLGVKLACCTKESYEAARARARSEAKASGQLIIPHDRNTVDLFPGILGETADTPRRYVVLKVTDPEKKIAGFAFRQGDGRLLPVRQQRTSGDMRGFYFEVLPPNDLELVVYLAVPEAIEVIPFKVENIPLP